MFGWSKKIKTPITEAEPVKVSTIPVDFYAGKNPVVKFKKITTEVSWDKAGGVGLGASSTRAVASEGGVARWLFNPIAWLTNSKLLIIIGVALFVLFIIGAGVYYWFFTQQPTAPQNIAYQPIVKPPEEALPTTTAPEVMPATPEETATASPPSSIDENIPFALGEAPLTFPSLFLADSADLDKDGLTDLEEESFITDPSIADTDNDRHSDSTEVYNLYNPAGKEPMKIIESDLVKEFINPVFGYKVYYPLNWAMGNVDQNYQDVLFSTLTGENIEIRVLDKPVEQTFADWFNVNATTQKFSDLTEFVSVFKQKGFRRNDWLAYYFTDANHVYAVVYNNADLQQTINYRTVIKMVARSFKFFNNKEVVPVEASPAPGVLFDNITNTLTNTSSTVIK